jgi:hypothetical protein
MRSLIESCIDVGSGFLLATFLQLLVFPFFDLYPTLTDSAGIAIVFTCVSICRSWMWRLLFRRIK